MNRIDRPSACPDFLEVFTDFVDGNLSSDQEGEIHAHLDCCEDCLRHLAAYRRGVMTLKASERDVDPVTFWGALERRLWTEGHLAGGRDRDERAARWRHPALAVAAAACFAVVVFFAGMWGDHALHDARAGAGERTVLMRGAVGGAPVVLESEPVALPTTMPADPRPAGARGSEIAASPSGPARILHATLETGADPTPTAPVAVTDPVERAAEAAYVASLERELAAWETIQRTHERSVRGALRRSWNGSRMSADGWVEPVRLGTAGIRTLQARAPVVAWPVEAAISLP